jgi:hypothetical protein
MRDQLADVLYAHGATPSRCHILADALLPVVRKIAATAIRAEADELREVALLAKEGQQWNPHRVWTWLSDRADVLDPS